jgi:hypothetical protein
MHLAAKAALVPTVLKSVFYKIIMSPNSSQEIFIMTILHTTFGGFIKVKLLDGLEYRPPPSPNSQYFVILFGVSSNPPEQHPSKFYYYYYYYYYYYFLNLYIQDFEYVLYY